MGPLPQSCSLWTVTGGVACEPWEGRARTVPILSRARHRAEQRCAVSLNRWASLWDRSSCRKAHQRERVV